VSDVDHRLPRSVRPVAYRLTTRIDPDESTFSGSVEVDLRVDADCERFECNAAELVIESVTLDGADVAWELRADDERLVIDAPAVEGTAPVLRIAFAGDLTDRLVGLYLARTTRPDGTTSTMAVTQMEATHARKVFPCWDEPDAKATFEITIEAPSRLTVLSNSPVVESSAAGDGWTSHRHEPTMAMSTYLVAMVVGELVVGAHGSTRDVPVSVMHTPGKEGLSDFALEVAVHAVAWFEDYFGIAFPAPKLDLVGIPDFSFGAMENHGCVTFREAALLLDPASATPTELERVATIVAHEIAHMWFGNLVTMAWWEGIWLNEAFATFMELSCVDAFRPGWGVWQRSALGVCEALDTDALLATRAIEYPVITPSDADDMFDELTYEKGAAVLRMLEGYLGADGFRNGVRRYLDAHRGGNTDTGDLWSALGAETGERIEEIAGSWIHQGGHPIVEVTATRRGLRVDQRRFTYRGVDDRRWEIPVVATAMVGGTPVDGTLVGGTATVRRGVVGSDGLDLDFGGEPHDVLVNPGRVGCYRVVFDISLLARLDTLASSELLALIDDLWASTLAGRSSATELVDLLGRLPSAAAADDPTLWRRIATVSRALVSAAGPELRAAAMDLIRSISGPEVRARLGPEATAVALGTAGGTGGAPDVIEEALRCWRDPSLDPATAAAMLSVAAAAADAALIDELLERYRHAEDPQVQARVVMALPQLGDPALAHRLVDAARTEIRSQSASAVIAGALANPSIAAVIWVEVEQRWAELIGRLPHSHHDRMISGIRGIYDAALAARIEGFLDSVGFGAGSRPVAQHRERLEVNVSAAPRLRRDLAVALGR